jgi:DNA-binding CsgD family transcriptional regulator
VDRVTAVVRRLHAFTPPQIACPAPRPELSPREAQVLVALCHGHTDAQIATRLGLSEDTVGTHTKRLYRKIGAANRPHAVALAYACELEVLA